MQSPFPGMDPFIEAGDLWGDFTHSLICAIADLLGEVLPEKYAPRIGNREYTAVCYSEDECVYPTPPHVLRALAPDAARAVVVDENAPRTLKAFIAEPHKQLYLNVLHFDPKPRLVTRIEVLAPANKKRGFKGRLLYERQRRKLLQGTVNFIEIDLLRNGERMPMLDRLPDSPYYLLVAREEWAPTCRVWPAFFDRPLPPIPIPLSKPDPDIPLALQPLVDAIYQRARYREQLDYSKQLSPALTPEQTAWLARQLAGEAGATRPRPPRARRRR